MKKVNKKVLKLVERAIRNDAVNRIGGFPPPCSGIWHQPKRPMNQKKETVKICLKKRT